MLGASSSAAPKGHEKVKKGLDHDEMRRKREATTVQIRKDKKEESIQKRRRDVGGRSTDDDSSLSARRNTDQVGALPDPALKIKLDHLPDDIELLHSDDPAEQLDATTRFRKLLSIERNPPIAEVIAAGAVPRLVQFCQCCACHVHVAPLPSPSHHSSFLPHSSPLAPTIARADDNAPLLFEAAWTLTNISSGTSEHTRVVIDNGAIPIFVNLGKRGTVEPTPTRCMARWRASQELTHARVHACSQSAVPTRTCASRRFGPLGILLATRRGAETWSSPTTLPSGCCPTS